MILLVAENPSATKRHYKFMLERIEGKWFTPGNGCLTGKNHGNYLVCGSFDYACAARCLPRFRGRLATFELASFTWKISFDGNWGHAKAIGGCSRHDVEGGRTCEQRGRGLILIEHRVKRSKSFCEFSRHKHRYRSSPTFQRIVVLLCNTNFVGKLLLRQTSIGPHDFESLGESS